MSIPHADFFSNLLEVARRVALRLNYGRVDLVAVIGLMAVARPLAIATGSRYDYPYYESHWGLMLSGADPWATTNAYGPAYNLLAGAFAFHPLLPKVMFVLGWLSCCSYLLRKLANSGVGIPGLVVWSAALPLNPLFWIFVVVYGVVDALVGTFCILALALLQADRRATRGLHARPCGTAEVLPDRHGAVYGYPRSSDRPSVCDESGQYAVCWVYSERSRVGKFDV